MLVTERFKSTLHVSKHEKEFKDRHTRRNVDDGTDAEIIVFTSESIENIPAGFRARETYKILGPDEFTEVFEIAEPGKDFQIYSEDHFKRKK